MLIMSLASFTAFAETFDVNTSVKVNGVNCATGTSGVYVYPNKSDEALVIHCSEYNFRSAGLLVYDKDGLLIEAGSNLLANEGGTNGSPRLTV